MRNVDFDEICWKISQNEILSRSNVYFIQLTMGEIDWEQPGIHRGNLITCAGSERVTDRVCSIKWHSGAPVYF